ncbi:MULTISPECIES: DUF2986 domain-containing protein [Aliivibrio]|jgi:hypothetical protein|uniref:DUF2986 domain-containing protein n=1 Tax=Aliivibrio finisterrensis TaxID=511998 RepID=A0A4Q5KZ86_9GAMM|nr:MULTISPECIES: DUF2986 domain-containing protein [Aliivibrio]MDD9175321.1 DUF2986 domain-containing protein [Aliivibrio sp. S3TY1]MDD9178087.1 DUF2986 domain-containing protein [Aliivibrio sp. A6]MDD9192400.1 DUF2986 domain-containing protein [Aliivibrio sp. S2TY2]RYU47589.1 DUF2986 domain-containing protein [Aliivibrio finisterrensis]RYU53627.1 DUF2986 domain-containing protein [Aliivibrio finisterrensis]
MSRKNKVKETLLKKHRRTQTKNSRSHNKPKYISKADREKMALEAEQTTVEPENTEQVTPSEE